MITHTNCQQIITTLLLSMKDVLNVCEMARWSYLMAKVGDLRFSAEQSIQDHQRLQIQKLTKCLTLVAIDALIDESFG